MKVELTIAALCWFLLAFGHTMIGFRWVLPKLTAEGLPATPFGPPSMTLGMLVFSWHIVSVVLVGFGVLLLTLAWAPDANPETLLLRWFAVFLLAATALAFWRARRRPLSLLRPPVPLVFVVIAVMCVAASR